MESVRVRLGKLVEVFRHASKFAIVGGYGDIGMHVAEQLVRRGYAVLVLGRSEFLMDQVVQALRERLIGDTTLSVTIASFRLDWHDLEEVTQFVAALHDLFGVPKVIVMTQGDYRFDQMSLALVHERETSMAVAISVEHHYVANVTSKVCFIEECLRQRPGGYCGTHVFMIGSIAAGFDPCTEDGRDKLRRYLGDKYYTQIGYALSQRVLRERTQALLVRAHYVQVPLIAGHVQQTYFPDVPPEQCAPIEAAVWTPIRRILDEHSL